MKLLELLKWGNSQLLEISFGLLILCSLPFLAYFLIKKWKFVLCVVGAIALCYFGSQYYYFNRNEKMEQRRALHEQCFAKCTSKNYYTDLFTIPIQNLHDKIMWTDSVTDGGNRYYKTNVSQDGSNEYGIEVKATFDNIYYYSYEIFPEEFDESFFEKNGYEKIEIPDDSLVEFLGYQFSSKEFDDGLSYKKDDIIIKVHKFCSSENYSCPMHRITVYNSTKENLIDKI